MLEKKILCTIVEISNNFNNLKKISSKIQDAIILSAKALKNNKKILIFGNGGSAADAQHLAAELVGKYLKHRKALPAIALTTDTSIITAISNDYSYNNIFTRQLEALSSKGDVIIAITTSGKSTNVLKALKYAKKNNLKSIVLTGEKGAHLKSQCNVCLIAPHYRPDRIQEMHIAIGQIICEHLENKLC